MAECLVLLVLTARTCGHSCVGIRHAMSEVRHSKEDGDDSKLDSSGPVASSLEDSKANVLEDYYKLPPAVKRRVRALKKLQYETMTIDAAFYKELFELEMKYDLQHQGVFQKRKEIVTGQHEPADDECDWPSDNENVTADGDEVEKLCDDVEKKAAFQASDSGDNENLKGIPEFWLKTLRNVSLLDEMIKEHDVDILKHLIDVRCILHSDEPGFSIEFHFSPNKYFVDKVLTKRYFFDYEISRDEPFEYEGPEIVRTKGCAINWNPGKNVTVKLIKKVQKKKSGNAKRTITKSVQEDSFFNFFDPPSEALTDDLKDEEVHELNQRHHRGRHHKRAGNAPSEVPECKQQ
ncbi:Nucleosome assembly protein 1 [Fasciola hepatica]|uniref:Nucleosome assembly protein 1 n=1 Tax=Fasciola hepatica TaxID=6192 RepID=A0A4E0R0T3_FASHE|nr:Nucleosome assembly protein 1 [Fasciola hepatica]